MGIYTHLLQTNPQALLEIKNDTIVEWLHEFQDDLLAQWYSKHQLHAQAAITYRNKALVEQMDIGRRVELYTRALIQAKAAVTYSSDDYAQASRNGFHESEIDLDVHQFEDEFDLLKLQKEVCEALALQSSSDLR